MGTLIIYSTSKSDFIQATTIFTVAIVISITLTKKTNKIKHTKLQKKSDIKLLIKYTDI